MTRSMRRRTAHSEAAAVGISLLSFIPVMKERSCWVLHPPTSFLEMALRMTAGICFRCCAAATAT